ARARVDRDDGVAAVVLAGEQRVLLQPLELAPQRRDRGGDLVGHLAVHGVELTRVLVVAGEALVALEPLRQPRVLGGDASRVLLIVPESRRAELLLELGDATPQPVRVKANHEPRRAGSRSPRAAAPAAAASPRSSK